MYKIKTSKECKQPKKPDLYHDKQDRVSVALFYNKDFRYIIEMSEHLFQNN